MHNNINDPIGRLFTLLFRDQSISIIHSCFVTLQNVLKESFLKAVTLSKDEVGAFIANNIQQPVLQLYHDLMDLEYTASEELVLNVETESRNLFTAILDAIPKEGDFMIISYIAYSIYGIMQKVTASYTIHLEELFLQ